MEPDVIALPGSRDPGSLPGAASSPLRPASSGEVLAGLFSQHYVALVRLTAVLLRDLTTAQEVVQDAFVAMHRRRLKDPDKALAYLRRAVVNGSRSAPRQRAVQDGNPPQPLPGMPSAGQRAIARLATSAVAAALGALPRRQREAVVLRYYADLSETETAAAMGISEGAVKSHADRGMAALARRTP
jgi:RNA polymerase sigma-70 factor (sigma-E family)